MFEGFFRRRKIRKYAKKLPRDLEKHYGLKNYYSRSEVDAALKRQRLDHSGGVITPDSYYVYAMYCSRAEVDAIQETSGESIDYDAIRSDVSATLFYGASDFSFSTLLNAAPDSSTGSFDSYGDSGGGDSGGGGGGGGGD